MQTLVIVALSVLLAAFFVTGIIIDRKNRATPLTAAEDAERQEWDHAIR